MGITEDMLMIQTLDPSASLGLSHGNQWYVSARIHIAKDGFLTGGVKFAPTPEEAVHQFLMGLQTLSASERIVTRETAEGRTESYWNGAGFVSQTVEREVMNWGENRRE